MGSWKMIDNFDKILDLMEFPSDDCFYFIQLLQRKKEHPELGSNSRLVKSYYIKSKEHLMDLKEEIIGLCGFHNARAYIHLQYRSFQQCTFQMLKSVTDHIMQPDYNHTYHIWNSVCGQFGAGPKRWVVDADNADLERYGISVGDIVDFIETLEHNPSDIHIVMEVLPTKNGYHVITHPFNSKQFGDRFPDIQIQKNNPTVLYIP